MVALLFETSREENTDFSSGIRKALWGKGLPGWASRGRREEP